MKTVAEKAERWLNDNVANWDATQLNALSFLLKEQDRDTRHKCADAVVSLVVVTKDSAHAACMNARAI